KANQLQWEFAALEAMAGHGVARAEWRDPAAVLDVVRLLSRYHDMNHCFFPEGGGQHIAGASLCEGGTMLAADCGRRRRLHRLTNQASSGAIPESPRVRLCRPGGRRS